MTAAVVWRCPVCRGGVPLTLVDGGRTWRCELDGHAFDVAKEGYVNLLVTHQRKARPPGDSAEMLRARRRFLDGGWYEPLREAIRATTTPERRGGAGHVLDAGCGEGYYTRGWDAPVSGVDIAKDAARLAARRATPGATYAVGNVYDLPVLDSSVDVVVSVFAPLHTDEFDRVLRPGGTAVVVTPGPEHLAGLAAVLFDEVVPHPGDPPFERAGATTTRVRFDLDLAGEAIADLLAMTPYSWFVDADRRARVASLDGLRTPADFLVTTYHLG